MSRIGWILSRLLASVVSVVVMIAIAVVAFFVSVFVVSTGASLGGYDPSGDYVVLAASLLVVAAIVAGALSPSVRVAAEPEHRAAEVDDPTYD